LEPGKFTADNIDEIEGMELASEGADEEQHQTPTAGYNNPF